MADAELDLQRWPARYDLFGVQLSATTYGDLRARVLQAASCGVPGTVDHMPVHGLVEGARNPELRKVFNGLSVLAPDGQPVRWALNAFHGLALADRVYGPEFMTQLCREAAVEGVGIYLYGGSPHTVAALARRLKGAYPAIHVSGCESPPYRELTPEEDAAVVHRINNSGAGIVFIGLGCPKQEVFAHRHRESIRGVQVCVGAAFDFLAGEKRMAPRWMQDRGLEWAFRLLSEPRRLWRRYLVTNTVFMLLVAREMLRGGVRLGVTPRSGRGRPGPRGR